MQAFFESGQTYSAKVAMHANEIRIASKISIRFRQTLTETYMTVATKGELLFFICKSYERHRPALPCRGTNAARRAPLKVTSTALPA
jgi:hypothetical protein